MVANIMAASKHWLKVPVQQDWSFNMRPDHNRNRDDNRPPSEFQEQVIHIARVARVVKGGRRFRFRALVAVGNGRDKVGVGIAKGGDVQAAVTKAVEIAKKQLIIIPLVKETIPHETTSKIGGGVVLLKPAAPGTGVIAGGTVRAILDLSGVRNILSKSLGSTNKVNIAYATIDALKKLKPANEWITQDTAKQRTVRKVPAAAEKSE
jgi:small subunit ribosomal protein S5